MTHPSFDKYLSISPAPTMVLERLLPVSDSAIPTPRIDSWSSSKSLDSNNHEWWNLMLGPSPQHFGMISFHCYPKNIFSPISSEDTRTEWPGTWVWLRKSFSKGLIPWRAQWKVIFSHSSTASIASAYWVVLCAELGKLGASGNTEISGRVPSQEKLKKKINGEITMLTLQSRYSF